MKPRYAIASLAGCCALTHLAEAAPPTNMAAAEALFQEAREMMSHGQFSAACPKLAESQRLDPAVGTLLYLAECYEKNGQTATAWATFELAAAEGRKDKQEEREAVAKERAQRLLPKLSRLTISVADTARIQGLVVTSDGAAVGSATWGSSLPIDPGKHVISATAPGKKPWSVEVNVSPDAATTQVAIPLLEDEAPAPVAAPTAAPAEPAAPEPAQPQADPVQPPQQSYWGTQRILGVSLASAGVIGIGVGAAFAIAAQNKESDADKYCSASDENRCTQPGVDLIDSAKSQNRLGNIFMGAGGALLIGGAVVFLTSPTQSERPTVARKASQLAFVPAVSSNGGAFLINGRF